MSFLSNEKFSSFLSTGPAWLPQLCVLTICFRALGKQGTDVSKLLLSFQLPSAGRVQHYWQATAGRAELAAATGHFEKGRRETMHKPTIPLEKECVLWSFCLRLSSGMVRCLLALGYKEQSAWGRNCTVLLLALSLEESKAKIFQSFSVISIDVAFKISSEIPATSSCKTVPQTTEVS